LSKVRECFIKVFSELIWNPAISKFLNSAQSRGGTAPKNHDGTVSVPSWKILLCHSGNLSELCLVAGFFWAWSREQVQHAEVLFLLVSSGSVIAMLFRFFFCTEQKTTWSLWSLYSNFVTLVW
jgi:hypothetical protein